MSNTITAYFKGRTGIAESVYQNDYGMILIFDGIYLPANFDAYFTVSGSDTSIPAVGEDNRVVIPNAVLATSGPVEVHVAVHTGENDSEVEYTAYFKVIARSRPVDDGTPEQMTAVGQALALLQTPIGNIETIVNEALSFTGETFTEMQEDLDEWKDGVEGDLDTWKDGVEDGLTTWKGGVESDFTTLQNQYDTAVAALTVDSEVADIRVGDDGVTYNSAGAAVRTQFSNVKADIDYKVDSMTESTKNLFNPDNTITLYKMSRVGGTYKNTQTDTASKYNFQVATYDENGTRNELSTSTSISSAGRYSKTLNPTANIKKIRVTHNGTNTNLYFETAVDLTANITYKISIYIDGFDPTTVGGVVIRDVQVEQGNTNTEYEYCRNPVDNEARRMIANESAYFENLTHIDLPMIDQLVSGKRIKTNYNIGETVDVTPEDSSFGYIITATLAGESYKLSGSGGGTPRLWCITDSSYKVLDVALSNASVSIDSPLTLDIEQDGYLIYNTSTENPSNLSFTKVNGRAIKDVIEEQEEQNGFHIFGQGIDCDVDVDAVSALTDFLPADKPLDYFYDLYDGLVSDYSSYITKVDCDDLAVADGITRPSGMEDYPIYMYKFIPMPTPLSGSDRTKTLAKRTKVMVLTGTHSEYTAINGCYHAMESICSDWRSDRNRQALRWDCDIYVIPCSNPWGVQNISRLNMNGVDLNRNMDTSLWEEGTYGSQNYGGSSAGSEYESKVLAMLIDDIKPDIFIDHHNFYSGEPLNLMYGICTSQFAKEVACDAVSFITQRFMKNYPAIFGTTLLSPMGLVQSTTHGTRQFYAYEHGVFSYTFESCEALYWSDGTNNDPTYERLTSNVETLAYDAFINFLVRAIKGWCDNTRAIPEY